MGKNDITLKKLLTQPDVFVDIFNVKLFNGEKVLSEEDVSPVDSDGLFANNNECKQKYRDVIKKTAFGIDFVLLGIENQESVDYTMPARVMLYDAISYDDLISEVANQNRLDHNDAYAKRIHKSQKINPVITLVIYYGNNSWDGPTSIMEMLKIPEEPKYKSMLSYIHDYKMNLIEMKKLTREEISQFSSDFQLIARVCTEKAAQLKEDLKKDTRKIKHRETLEALSVITKDDKFLKIGDSVKEGGLEMCELVELIEKDGEAKGEEKGKIMAAIEIAKSLKNILSNEEIAKATKLPLAEVEKL